MPRGSGTQPDVQGRRAPVWGPPVGPPRVHEARSVGRVPRAAQDASVGGVERCAAVHERHDVVERQVMRRVSRMVRAIARADVAVLPDVPGDHPLREARPTRIRVDAVAGTDTRAARMLAAASRGSAGDHAADRAQLHPRMVDRLADAVYSPAVLHLAMDGAAIAGPQFVICLAVMMSRPSRPLARGRVSIGVSDEGRPRMDECQRADQALANLAFRVEILERAANEPGRQGTGAAAGAVTGFIAGIPLGPVGMGVTAGLGAIAGAVVGQAADVQKARTTLPEEMPGSRWVAARGELDNARRLRAAGQCAEALRVATEAMGR